VKWTVVGGVSIPPVVGDWDNAGSGDVDLDSVFGDDVIVTAHKLGNYVVIYGKKTIAMQEYTGASATKPYSFYTRVKGTGTPSKRGVVNLGEKHYILGWDNIYLFTGGTYVDSVGDAISDALFKEINPEYISRCFLTYMEDRDEIRVHYPSIGATLPNSYFSYNLKNKSWSRGVREYTGSGMFVNVVSETWASIGNGTATWESISARWGDVRQEALYPTNLFGDSNGIVYQDDEISLNNGGEVIDGWWESKDFVIGDNYREQITNWMSVGFEARGDTLTLECSTDLGVSWSTPISYTLTSSFSYYKLDLSVNSPQIRFRFRNSTLNETFTLRMIRLSYVEATNRGVA